MKTLPKSMIERSELNLRQGIKSSLSNIRSVVSLLYILYISNDRKAYVEYSDELIQGGHTQINIKPALLSKITAEISVTDTLINNSPLFKSQMEALQVGIELFLRLGKISFNDQAFPSSHERTGGNRFDKNIKFGTNIKMLDIYLSALDKPIRNAFLVSWLNNKVSTNSEIENSVKQMLTIFTEETQFKIRNKGREIVFQQEGIYEELCLGRSVESTDDRELVGPYRIYKSYTREELHPYVVDSGSEFNVGVSKESEFKEYAQLVSNNLDLAPKRTTITQLEYISEPVAAEDESHDIQTTNNCDESVQRIYFGAPGTSKSYTIKNDILRDIDDQYIFRTTFHPDSDYSSFVGCYKPVVHSSRILRTDYTIDSLASLLQQKYTSASSDETVLYAFVLEYAGYFNGEISTFDKRNFILKAGLPEDYEEKVNRMLNLHQWMIDNKYLSSTSTISYEFSPEVFTDAYVAAWNNPTKPIHLVIEEINRGNCAQIFGDIFQLLDRKNGISEYAIKADAALCQYLCKTLKGEGLEGIKNGKLKLPSNLSIYATMNTSDQSLFPMDSAFKRRWEWEFMPINSSKVDYAKIVIGDNEYRWSDFITKINKKIIDTCKSEDKQLGAFFIKVSEENPVIEWELFRSKVMSFLWFDIYKDLYESDENTVFRCYENENRENMIEFSFGMLFDGDVSEQKRILQKFMEYNEVE